MKKTDSGKQAPEMQGRRRALKTAILGGAAAAVMPEKWTRPVVDSVLLPSHATTTSDVIDVTDSSPPSFLEPGGLGAMSYPESFPDIILPPDEAEIEQAAAQASNLSDILISAAHATVSLNFTTRYSIENKGGGNYHFTSLRIFDGSSNRWFSAGTLTVGNTTACDTFFNCALRPHYKKSVTLNSVTANLATITIDFAGVFSYTKEIELNQGGPDVC